MKPNKWHLRQYSLNDSNTGYLVSFRFYRGKKEKYPDGISATQFPYILTNNDRLINNGHILVVDRFYTSVKLLNMLQERGIGILGTIMPNRCNIEKGKLLNNNRNVKRGDLKVYNHTIDNYKLVSWIDNKVVNLMTSLDTGWHITTRKGANGARCDINCPTVISLYTQK